MHGIEILLLVIIVILTRIPPLNFSFIGISIHSYSLIGVLLTLSLTHILFLSKKNTHRYINQECIYISLYLVSITVGILFAKNIYSFFTTFKDVIMSLCIYLITINVVKKRNIQTILFAILFSTAINIFYQVITYHLPTFSQKYFEPVIYNKYIQFFYYQSGRDRFFGDSFDEIFLPLVFYVLINTKEVKLKIISAIIFFGILYISVISNWRTKTIIMLLSLVIIFLRFLFKKVRALLFLFVISISLFMAISYSGIFGYLNQNKYNLDIISRLSFEDNVDVKTINSRFTLWEAAKKINTYSPIFGVGLGNYYEYLSIKQKNHNKSLPGNHKSFIIIDDPHNLFFSTLATSGIVGFVTLLILLIHFASLDFRLLMKQYSHLNVSIVSAFWLLFLYALLNPWLYFSYLALFWLLRGLIHVIYYE